MAPVLKVVYKRVIVETIYFGPCVTESATVGHMVDERPKLSPPPCKYSEASLDLREFHIMHRSVSRLVLAL